MNKLINYDSELAEKVLAGISKAEKAVCSSLGPAGRPSLLMKGGTAKITKDGISIFNSLSFKDPFEEAGVVALREASAKTNSDAGDGTTTSTEIAYSIYKNGLKYITMDANPVLIKRGIDKAAKKVIEYLKSVSKPISTKEEIKQVALISANNDEEIAEVIAEVLSKVGNSTVKIESGGTEMAYTVVEGMSFDKGYVSMAFATNEKLECNLESPYVLVTDKKISSINQILKPLQSIARAMRPLLIVCEDIEGDALSVLVLNKLNKGLPICCVKAPSYGANRKGMLQDIAALTGGRVVSDENGIALDNVTVEDGVMGVAKSVTVNKDTTVIIGSDATKDSLAKYVEGLNAQVEQTKDEFENKKLVERVSRLTTGIAKIFVGAHTEAELNEKKDRVIDAFSAAKASMKEGIVPGGGVALLRAMQDVDFDSITDNVDEKLGVNILKKSLSSPARKIFDNAGLDSSLIVSKILENENKNAGYDALKNEYVDMLDAGIVDPTLVECSVVQNASSVASLLLTTVCAVVDDPDDKPVQSAYPSGMGGMM